MFLAQYELLDMVPSKRRQSLPPTQTEKKPIDRVSTAVDRSHWRANVRTGTPEGDDRVFAPGETYVQPAEPRGGSES